MSEASNFNLLAQKKFVATQKLLIQKMWVRNSLLPKNYWSIQIMCPKIRASLGPLGVNLKVNEKVIERSTPANNFLLTGVKPGKNSSVTGVLQPVISN